MASAIRIIPIFLLGALGNPQGTRIHLYGENPTKCHLTVPMRHSSVNKRGGELSVISQK